MERLKPKPSSDGNLASVFCSKQKLNLTATSQINTMITLLRRCRKKEILDISVAWSYRKNDSHRLQALGSKSS